MSVKTKHWTEGECYYVSVIDGERRGLLAGPFRTRDEALGLVDAARNTAYKVDPRAWFYAFGTAKAPDGSKNGVLNDLLKIEIKRP